MWKFAFLEVCSIYMEVSAIWSSVLCGGVCCGCVGCVGVHCQGSYRIKSFNK